MSLEIPNEGLDLRLDQIVVTPENNSRVPGEDDPQVRELADSIRDNGQLHPVLVTLADDGRFELVVGFRRVAAIALLNKNSRTDRIIRATVIDVSGKGGRLNAFRANVHENLKRKAYSPLDLLHIINKLASEFKMKKVQIAKELGKSQAWVSTMSKLNALNDKQKHQLHTGALSVDAALELLTLSEEQREKVEQEARVATRASKAAGKTRGTAGSVSASAVKKAARKAAASQSSSSTSPKSAASKSAAPAAGRRVPSMKEFREFLSEHLGPTTNEPVQHFMIYLIEVSSGRASESDISKAAADVLALAKNPKATTQWSVKTEPAKKSAAKKAAKASKKAAKGKK